MAVSPARAGEKVGPQARHGFKLLLRFRQKGRFVLPILFYGSGRFFKNCNVRPSVVGAGSQNRLLRSSFLAAAPLTFSTWKSLKTRCPEPLCREEITLVDPIQSTGPIRPELSVGPRLGSMKSRVLEGLR